MMLDIVERAGTETVWRVGLRVLGFPPTWVTTGKERAAVVAALA